MNDRHLMVVTTFAKASKWIKEEGYEAGDIAGLLDGESWKIERTETSTSMRLKIAICL